ncbi:MAG: hypothetical protein IPM60_10815 [Rhodospirillales bacterium]|nr:hypothetical protein [Rhodospirillales bacterium]
MTSAMLQRRVTAFVAVFHEYVSTFGSADLGRDGRRYRKILFFSILEALAKARYPKERSASDAFSRFVVQHCDWSEGERISLPHLVAALERTSCCAFDDLRGWAYSELRGWGSGGPLWLDRDPEKASIQKRWPKEGGNYRNIQELKLGWTALQHRNLIYRYRSKLSHEAREQTMSFEDGLEQRPFYESIGNNGSPHTEWHLVYPTAFLAAACRTGIESLRVWLLAEGRDPYCQFPFGRFLIEELNNPDVPVRHEFS